MSQTRWLLNGSSVTCLSVEECIYNIFKNIFLFSNGTFISSGREDKDVRMMNIGRPFVFVLKETKFSLLNFYLFFKKIKTIEKINNIEIDSNVLQIQTIQEIINFIQNYNNIHATYVYDNDKELSDNEKDLIGNIKTVCDNIKNEKTTTGVLSPTINNCYTLINKENTCILYDVNTNKIVIEQPKYKIIEQKKIGNIQICNNCNEELEILLSQEIFISNTAGHNDNACHNNTTHSNHNIEHNNIRNDSLNLSVNVSQQNENYNLKKYYVSNTNSFNNINTLVDVKLSNVAFSTNYELIKKIIKYGEDRKKKYKCLIYHSTPMSRVKIKKINENVFNYEKKNKNDSYVINIMQKTPIRVLHRRGLINRERKIYEFNLVFIHKHFSLLYLLTQAGTYIKEFVNGDRGRTFPNLKYFFGENCFVNILNLDVSSFIYDND
uniref:tRNA pseudouridine(55) synthase n=1 Tax=Piliocolobus tephrosceles TaxID=591936 RepID=A0A8C9GSI5_9PRIM